MKTADPTSSDMLEHDAASVDAAPPGRLRPIAPSEAGWWASVTAFGPGHPSLISTADVAAALGVKPQTIRVWRMRGDFPRPVVVAGQTRHIRREMQTWALTHGHDPSRLAASPYSR